MKAEIVTIGDEILIGQITDTNSKWIAERLNEIGISVYQITSVQDNREHILKALAEAGQNADIVIMTGGLGPTKDDITKHTLVDFFNDELVFNEAVYRHIKGFFERMKIPPTKFDKQQAMLPAKATLLENKIGTAAGMWFEKNGKVFISLPGVPAEMKGLMLNEVLPRFKEKFRLPYIVHKTIITYGINESNVARILESWEEQLPENIKLAYLPSYEKLRLRFTAQGDDKEALLTAIEKEIAKLYPLIGEYIIGVDENELLEVVINRKMTQLGGTLSLAESCTGGKIASLLTAIPGASNFLKGALVAYSAAVKVNVLGVRQETIDTHSVVSAEVAKEMAIQSRKVFGTDYAVATTGNAGPTTDATDRSVGVVFIAVASPEEVVVKEFNFGQPREKVIRRASSKALEMLKKEIDKNSSNSL